MTRIKPEHTRHLAPHERPAAHTASELVEVISSYQEQLANPPPFIMRNKDKTGRKKSRSKKRGQNEGSSPGFWTILRENPEKILEKDFEEDSAPGTVQKMVELMEELCHRSVISTYSVRSGGMVKRFYFHEEIGEDNPQSFPEDLDSEGTVSLSSQLSLRGEPDLDYRLLIGYTSKGEVGVMISPTNHQPHSVMYSDYHERGDTWGFVLKGIGKKFDTAWELSSSTMFSFKEAALIVLKDWPYISTDVARCWLNLTQPEYEDLEEGINQKYEECVDLLNMVNNTIQALQDHGYEVKNQSNIN